MRLLVSLLTAALPFSSAALAATPAAPSYTLSNNIPGFIKHATDTGPVDPATQINVTLWLKLHNQTQLDQLVSDQRSKGNAKFQKWITQTDFDTQFGPTAQEVKSVQNFVTDRIEFSGHDIPFLCFWPLQKSAQFSECQF